MRRQTSSAYIHCDTKKHEIILNIMKIWLSGFSTWFWPAVMAVWGCWMMICWGWPCCPWSCRVCPPCSWIWPGCTSWIYTRKQSHFQLPVTKTNIPVTTLTQIIFITLPYNVQAVNSKMYRKDAFTCCSPWAPDTGTCIMVWPWPPDMACTMMGCPEDVMSCPPLTCTIRGCPWTCRQENRAVIAAQTSFGSIWTTCDWQGGMHVNSQTSRSTLNQMVCFDIGARMYNQLYNIPNTLLSFNGMFAAEVKG